MSSIGSSEAVAAKKLLQRLQENDATLTALELTDQDITKNGGIALSEVTAALTHNTFVEFVSLRKIAVDEDFLKALETVPHIKHLALPCTGLNVASAKTLCQALTATNRFVAQLETLDLSGNVKLGPRGCQQLASSSATGSGGGSLLRADAPACLLDLNLSNVSMGHYGSQAIASHLPRTLQRLNLSHNAMGPDGLWKLAETLQSLHEMRHLDLSHNQILDDGCLEIAKHTLPSTPKLATLHLAGNGIGDTGLQALAAALAGSNVRELDLRDNSITNVGATALAELALSSSIALLQDEEEESGSSEDEKEEDNESVASIPNLAPVSQLQRINLSSNQIGSAGCTALAQALSRGAHCVAALDLSRNAIGDEGAGSFVELLDDMPGLRQLDLSGNHDVTQARTRILDMLLKHRSQALSPSTSSHTRHHHHNDATERSLETSVDHSEASHRSQSDRSLLVGMSEAVHAGPEESEDDVKRIVEEGRQLLRDSLNKDFSNGGDGTTIVEIPLAYAAHLTDQFSTERIVQYGAFGPLHTATDNRNDDDESSSPRKASGTIFIRHLTLQPPGPMAAVRESVLAELTELRHENLLLPTAYTSGPTSYCFLYHSSTKRTTLAELLQDEEHRKKMTWKIRIRCLNAVAQALAFLHSSNLGHKASFHGDVRPQNILVETSKTITDGEQQYSYSNIQLMDGGLSRLVGTDRSRFASGDVVFGSRGYRCPRYEHGSCQYDAASDMFSFGIFVAEVTTGRLQRSKGTGSMAWDAYYDLTGIITKQPTIQVDAKAGPVPKSLIEMLGKILLSCASPFVEKRPTSKSVAQLLGQVAST